MGQTTEELTDQISATRETLASDLDALQQKASPRAMVDRRKAAVGGRMRRLRSQVMGSMDSATSAAGSAGDTAREQSQTLAGNVEQRVEGSPLAAGMVAFGLGLLVGGLLPSSSGETRLSAEAVRTAREHGSGVAEAARDSGQQIADQLKSRADEAVGEVKETAQDSAQRVQEEASSSADRLKS